MAIPDPSSSSFLFQSAAFPPLSSSLPPKPPPSSAPSHPSSNRDIPPRDVSSKDWSSLFRSRPRNAGSFQPTHFDIVRDGKPKTIPDLVKEAGVKYWSDYLVGFFLDGSMSYTAVVSFLRKYFKLFGDLDIKTDGLNFYLLFSDDRDRIKVLQSDPIFIRGRMFIITRWNPSIGVSQSQVRTVPIWVHFHRIPLVLWTLIGINWLANHVGRLLCLDLSTERLNRVRYAKALIEVSPDFELPDVIQIAGLGELNPEVKVVYNWRPLICSHCKVFGHETSKCDSSKPANVNSVQAVNSDLGFEMKRSDKQVDSERIPGWFDVKKKKSKEWRKKNLNKETVNINLDKDGTVLVGEKVDKNFEVGNVAEKELHTEERDGGDNTVNNGLNGKDLPDLDGLAAKGVPVSNSFSPINDQPDDSYLSSLFDEDSVMLPKDKVPNLDQNNQQPVEHLNSSPVCKSYAAVTNSSSLKKKDKVVDRAAEAVSVSAVGFGSGINSGFKSKGVPSPYNHLVPPCFLELPPPCTSSQAKIKGKFWDSDDLDDGVLYGIDDVQPISSKSRKKHTRKNPSPLVPGLSF